MKFLTDLSADQYIGAFQMQMGSFTSFGEERFTGFFVGKFFSVCYHSGWEWNRKLTNEKNRAIGYVKNTPDGAEVSFVHLYGFANPISIVLLFLLGFVFGWFLWNMHGSMQTDGSAGLIISAVCGLAVMVPVVLESVLAAYFTERGQYGHGVLMAYLRNPADPWHYEKSNR